MVLGGEAWTKHKNPRLSNKETEVFSAFRSKLPIFHAFVRAVTAGNIGFRRQSLDKQNVVFFYRTYPCSR